MVSPDSTCSAAFSSHLLGSMIRGIRFLAPIAGSRTSSSNISSAVVAGEVVDVVAIA